MPINKNNYEIYFLDYHEGNLPAELVAELFLFLEKNPGLQAAFDEFENVQLPSAEKVIFPDKEFLKKEYIHDGNLSLFLVGHMEGTLSPEEKQQLKAYLDLHPEKANELPLFEKTRLQPDLSIVFPDKAQLKKTIPLYRQPHAWYYLAAAACVIFILGLFFLRQEQQSLLQQAERINRETKPVRNKQHPVVNENQMIQEDQPDEIKKQKQAQDTEQKGMSGNQLAIQNIQNHRHHPEGQKQKSANEIQQPDRMPVENITLMESQPGLLTAEPIEMYLSGHEPVRAAGEYYTLYADTQPVQLPEYSTIGQALRDYSRHRIRQTIGDEPLSDDLLNKQVPSNIKGIRFLGWCMERITGKRVNLSTTYNPQGELTAYRISAGRLQFGKTFASR